MELKANGTNLHIICSEIMARCARLVHPRSAVHMLGHYNIMATTSPKSRCNPSIMEMKMRWAKGKSKMIIFSPEILVRAGRHSALRSIHGRGGARWRPEAKKTAKGAKRRRSTVPSASAQMGQHSPSGMMGSAHSDMSSQITSSHMTVPLSQTQIWQGSGFHTSLSLYNCPSNVQLPNVPGRRKQLSVRGVAVAGRTREKCCANMQTGWSG